MQDLYTTGSGKFYKFNLKADPPTRWSAQALLAIQAAAEPYLVDLMQDGLCVAIHAKRVTLTAKDMRLVRRIRNTLIHFLDRFVYKNPKATPPSGAAKGASIMQPLASSDRSSILVSSSSGMTGRQQRVDSEAFWKQESAAVGADEVFFHRYFSTLGKGREKAGRKKKKKEEAKEDGEGDGSGESADEEEIWKALVDSRPELDEGSEGGFSEDLGSEMDGLEDDSDGSDFKVDIEGDDDAENNDVADADEDIPDFGDEDSEDALLGSDDELPVDLENSFPQDSKTSKRKAEPASAIPESKRGMKRRRLKNLPTFASAEDYAKMIDDEGE